MGKASLTFYVPIEKEDFKQVCSKALSKIATGTYSVEDDKIIYKEGRAVKSGTYRGLAGAKSEITYDSNNITIHTKCKGLAPSQTRHAEDTNTIIKRYIEMVINNKDEEEDNPDVVRCPKCGSNQIDIVARGWSLATGFIGSGKTDRICKNCMYKF